MTATEFLSQCRKGAVPNVTLPNAAQTEVLATIEMIAAKSGVNACSHVFYVWRSETDARTPSRTVAACKANRWVTVNVDGYKLTELGRTVLAAALAAATPASPAAVTP